MLKLGAGTLACAHACLAQQPALTIRPEQFQPNFSAAVLAELGEFAVPENRAKRSGRSITLRFVRFASRNPKPGPPIVYLAGGPGGSGTAAAAGPRWPIFDALREVADVIAFDQRGTGRSHTLPRCTSGAPVPNELPSTQTNLVNEYIKQVRHCRRFWDSAGVDLSAYNTNASADDLEDLRKALGVEKLDLWGISYGTHLALAALKRHPNSFRRAVLVSAEGLDQTVKMPSGTDAFFRRVQASIDRDSAARAVYPDVAGLIRRVLAKVSATPITARVSTQSGPADIVMGAFEMQLLTAERISDPDVTATILAAYRLADKGDYSAFADRAQRRTGQPIFIAPMPLAMDAASGISPAARARVAEEARTGLLGAAMNWPMPHVADELASLDLGEAFRAPFRGTQPVLIISGTLDGRTYPADHRAIAAMFSDARIVTVENGGHNTVMLAPEVQHRIKAFFAGESVSTASIVLPAPRWIQPHR
ncbi:MAG: alpha/beta hydrolase [Gemmatimonadota bacterium]